MKFSHVVAVVAILSQLIVSPSVGLPSQLQRGDTLVYAVTLDLQQHRVQQRVEASSQASGEGTETFHVYNIGADGTAYAKVEAHFQGTQDGKPVELHGNFFAKVYPDGQIRMQGGLERSLDEALNFANAITSEASQHVLVTGTAWKTILQTQFVNLTVQRRVTGRKLYQHFPAAVIESTANGTLKKSSDGSRASGSVTMGGTSYYDDRDRLLIGESIRMLTIMRPQDQAQTHTNYSAAINVVLSSLTHSSHEARGAQPTPTVVVPPTTTPAAAATPSPMQSGYGSTPAATVTPRSSY